MFFQGRRGSVEGEGDFALRKFNCFAKFCQKHGQHLGRAGQNIVSEGIS